MDKQDFSTHLLHAIKVAGNHNTYILHHFDKAITGGAPPCLEKLSHHYNSKSLNNKINKTVNKNRWTWHKNHQKGQKITSMIHQVNDVWSWNVGRDCKQKKNNVWNVGRDSKQKKNTVWNVGRDSKQKKNTVHIFADHLPQDNCKPTFSMSWSPFFKAAISFSRSLKLPKRREIIQMF